MLSDELREHIGNWLYANRHQEYQVRGDKLQASHAYLGKKSGVAQPVITRFLNGTRTITLETADKLAKCLDLELVKKQPKKPAKRKGVKKKKRK